jgi:hypothetical protein
MAVVVDEEKGVRPVRTRVMESVGLGHASHSADSEMETMVMLAMRRLAMMV